MADITVNDSIKIRDSDDAVALQQHISNTEMAENSGLLPSRLVHLDLKGAALSVEYLKTVLPLLKKWGCTGLLIEYEDMFPYKEELKVLASPSAYSDDDIKEILKASDDNGLEVIPLVQTFGHLEFVLKHQQFSSLREVPRYPMALCPSNPDAIETIKKILDQVKALHPDIKSFHIGCDEVYHLGLCSKCAERMLWDGLSREQLFFAHVRQVASHMKDKYEGLTVIVWDDMFRFSELPVMIDCGLGELVEPMVWHYPPQFTLPANLWSNLGAVFSKVWIASAFKGATGPRAAVTNIRYHLDNHSSWLEAVAMLRNSNGKLRTVQGIALTGWQRYDHYAVLCELFPQALPSLGLCLKFAQQEAWKSEEACAVARDLKFTAPIPLNPFASSEVPVCEFPGSSIYHLMIEFVRTEAALKEFFNADGLSAWLNDYNVRRNFINPVHVEPHLLTAESLLQALLSIDERLGPAFSGVFVEGVLEEWRAVFLAPAITKARDFVHLARGLASAPVGPGMVGIEFT